MYVIPRGGYQSTFSLTQKCDVTAQNQHPVFAYLKDKLLYPFSSTTSPQLIMWSHSDVA
ncbi:rCG36282 [Rattus norvegicus]|uniref:RCG36282 n=1 Tax=Rattus norvegicus TaxID=10116 RepID=A6IQ14_RAT|nr:rCG36282 [Rattus norvegicus]